MMDAGPVGGRQRGRHRRRPRFAGPSFNRIVPNILTLLGLCAGLAAIRFALDGKFEHAAASVAVAGLFDGLDGRLARLLRATSRFGAEFDSLSDFASFGIAPALIVYCWSLRGAGRFGFIPCVLFAVCMALRLARFNASLEGAPRPAYALNFFAGVPAPAGAGLALFPIFLGLEARSTGAAGLEAIASYPALAAGVLTGTAMLLVSSLPVWAFKNFKIPADYVLPLLLGIGLFAMLVVVEPWAAMAAAGLIYLGLLPFSVRSFRRLRADAGPERTKG